jgi:hypothetical protein
MENKESLSIIIDEAHNILSKTSFRESEDWKDYRLETFEEIIKEGRKEIWCICYNFKPTAK